MHFIYSGAELFAPVHLGKYSLVTPQLEEWDTMRKACLLESLSEKHHLPPCLHPSLPLLRDNFSLIFMRCVCCSHKATVIIFICLLGSSAAPDKELWNGKTRQRLVKISVKVACKVYFQYIKANKKSILKKYIVCYAV